MGYPGSALKKYNNSHPPKEENLNSSSLDFCREEIFNQRDFNVLIKPNKVPDRHLWGYGCVMDCQ